MRIDKKCSNVIHISSIDILTKYVNTCSVENEKELRVIEAAKTVFLRHGFRRVTMQDIADEAGISRPALYLVFPNKEEIFKATVLQVSFQSLTVIRANLPALTTVEERLNFAFEIWTVRNYELMISSPDARDLIDCTQGFARETMRKMSADFESLLVEILAPALSPANPGVLPVEIVAHLLASSVHGFKEVSTSIEELRAMVAGLVKLTLAATPLRPKP